MIDLREINKRQFVMAKRFWAVSSIMKLLVFAVGAWATFAVHSSIYAPQVMLLLAIASEGLHVVSDTKKSAAETLLRSLDICRSFGRDISEADKRDLLADLPRELRKRFAMQPRADVYFSSEMSPGPHAAIQNLLESAWYTRRQASAMVTLNLAVIALLLSLSIFALILAVRGTSSLPIQEQVIKHVTAWLMLLVSLGLIRNAWSYFRLFLRSQRTESACRHLVGGDVSEADALRQWYEYQVARAGAPMLPAWLWKLMRTGLDESWQHAKGGSA
ncbi:MAG: hypothetical protein V4813_15975 [Gemmatimonadota bacterium]